MTLSPTDPLADLEAATWTFAALIATLRDAHALAAPVSDVLAGSPQRTAVLQAAGLVTRDQGGFSLAGENPPVPGHRLEEKLSSFRQAVAAAAGDDAGGGGWATLDDAVLLNQGRASAAIGNALATKIVPQLAGLAGRLGDTGGRLLDVGTGIGAIAAELARAFPRSHVVGIDVLERVLKLADRQLDDDVADRVSFRHLDVADLPDEETYDLIWLPVPFLAEDVLAAAMHRTAAALRPNGWLVAGTFPPATGPLQQAIARWNAMRNGGNNFGTDTVAGLMSSNELREIRQFPPLPLGTVLVAGQRA
jgi:2-polyprenyl-3-methyl-5-hydroxy-6-metoxy-1,4-benzoquinol methylase